MQFYPRLNCENSLHLVRNAMVNVNASTQTEVSFDNERVYDTYITALENEGEQRETQIPDCNDMETEVVEIVELCTKKAE